MSHLSQVALLDRPHQGCAYPAAAIAFVGTTNEGYDGGKLERGCAGPQRSLMRLANAF